MFSPYIKNNLKFINEYFSLLIGGEKKKFPQSLIFYGEDVFAQYLLALNLARILNCKETKSTNCNCLNCNWVKDNNHPAVITVSKLDFKPDDDGAKTVISVKQTQAIKNLISTTSEYHRVFIFCDAEIKTPNSKEKEQINEFKQNGYSLPFEDNENEKFWIPNGITRKVFQEESANSMLKAIEEPPANTTFIFLTKDKSDLIETIISRSQNFYVPSVHSQNADTSLISQELRYYPEIDRLEINNIAAKLLANADAANCTPNELLTQFQQFIKQTALANSDNPTIVDKMLEDIRILSETQSQLKSYIKPQLALENAIYRIYKNWE